MAESRFTEITRVRVPSALNEALDLMVQAQCCTKSDYLRRALVQQLKADGGRVLGEPEKVANHA
jgi:hypothetical protein